MAKKVKIDSKKKLKQKQKQKQKQRQETNINIRIGDSVKKPREEFMPSANLPPVVYQTPPQLIFYGQPPEQSQGGTPPSGDVKAGPSMLFPEKVSKKAPILEDVGVGTEGLVQILDLPTKRETLSELITPVTKKPPKVRMEESGLGQQKEPEKVMRKPQQKSTIVDVKPKITILPEQPTQKTQFYREEMFIPSGKKTQNIQPEPLSQSPEFKITDSFYGAEDFIKPTKMYQNPMQFSSAISRTNRMREQPSQESFVGESQPSNILSDTTGRRRFIVPTKPRPTTEKTIMGTMQGQMKPKKSPESQRVQMPPEMQTTIFEPSIKKEPAILQPTETPPSIASYARPATMEAIFAPLPREKMKQNILSPFPQDDPRASGRDVRSVPGKMGGIFSKKMTQDEKIKAYSTFAGIPKESVTAENIEEARKEYNREKKRISRQKQIEQLPASFL